MTDLTGAVQKGLFAKLSTVADLSPVVTEVPIDEQGRAIYPFTLLGDDQVTEIGAKGDRFERHEVAVHVCMQSVTKIVVRGKQELVRVALHDQPIAADGAILSEPQQLSLNTPIMEDGATYVGTQIFLIFAQQTD